MLIARSPVRISFGGGGTDLPAYFQKYGGAVLSAAIDKYFYTILRRRTDGCTQVISSDLRKLERWTDADIQSSKGTELEIPLAVLRHLQCTPSVDLFMASEIPPGTGLGSSATACVNVLRIMSEYMKLELSPYEIAERAYYIAREMLGNPVGKQDEYAASVGGLNYIQFHSDGRVSVDPIALNPELSRELQSNLMLFFTGASHNSWEILQAQEKSTKKPSGMAVEALHEIRELASTMRDALRQGELARFGELLHVGWCAKKRISAQISTPLIDELYELARGKGAIGGKVTGAGGGGFLLLYVPSACQQNVREAFASQGLREMVFGFDQNGAQVIVNDPFLDGDAGCGSMWNFIEYPSGSDADWSSLRGASPWEAQ
jgi:D-glycero-alpha-D-manno-heptose-7-phosphate kinase